MEYDFNKAKKEYCDFCEMCKHDIQLFALPWYLDAVCDSPDDWRVILYKENGEIRAAFPFSYTKGRYGLKHIGTPWMAPRMGIWIDYRGKSQKRGKIENYENTIVQYVIDNLPPYDTFSIPFDSRFKNWQSFYRNNFSQTSLYSYVIYKDEPLDELFTSKLKQKINKSKKTCTISENLSATDFINFFSRTYKQRSRVISFPIENLRKLLLAMQQKNSCKIFACIDEGDCVGAACLFFDTRRVYNIFSSFDPTYKGSIQAPLLTAKSIEFAQMNGLDFDFEGSMIPGVAEYNREFGGYKEEYYLIKNEDTRYQAISLFSKIKKNIVKR